jgi:predicted nucleic acid-binding protein
MVEPRYLLDTNVVIGLLNGNAECTSLLHSADCVLADLAVSQITRMALLGFAGISEREEQTLRQFLSSVHVVLLNEAIEAQVILLRRQHKIKLPDAIIAATTLINGLTLLTLDQSLNKTVLSVAT